MTIQQADQLRSLLEQLLSQLPSKTDYSQHCVVRKFCQRYIRRSDDSDLSCAELYEVFSEAAEAGEFAKLTQSEFYLRLAQAMWSAHGVKKSHGLMRGGKLVRGFSGVDLRLDVVPVVPPVGNG